jgi:hypothetical protein
MSRERHFFILSPQMHHLWKNAERERERERQREREREIVCFKAQKGEET